MTNIDTILCHWLSSLFSLETVSSYILGKNEQSILLAAALIYLKSLVVVRRSSLSLTIYLRFSFLAAAAADALCLYC